MAVYMRGMMVFLLQRPKDAQLLNQKALERGESQDTGLSGPKSTFDQSPDIRVFVHFVPF